MVGRTACARMMRSRSRLRVSSVGERHRELAALGIEQGFDALPLLPSGSGRQDAPGATAGTVTDLGDEPLDRADAGKENPVADQPSRRPIDEEARPIVARPAQGVEPAGQPEAGLSIEREVAVAVAVTDQGHVPPTLPALAITVEDRRPARCQLPSHRGEHRGRHVGRIVEEGAQEAHRAELQREAEPVVVATKPGDDRTIGLVEVEVAVELLLGRLAGVSAVAAALLVAEEAGRHRCRTRTFREGRGAC
jgi:hypothetical protein